jgi:hypothetical protein
VALATGLVSCSGFIGPDENAPPESDASLEESALVNPVPMFHPCLGWLVPEPAGEMVLGDVVFVRPELASPPDQPTGQNLETLWRHHAHLLYQFHMPIVRAWIPKVELQSLSRDPGVLLIYAVADPTRHDFRVEVVVAPGQSIQQVADQFRALGGRVTNVYENIGALAGLLPDRAIPALRREPSVVAVEYALTFPIC